MEGKYFIHITLNGNKFDTCVRRIHASTNHLFAAVHIRRHISTSAISRISLPPLTLQVWYTLHYHPSPHPHHIHIECIHPHHVHHTSWWRWMMTYGGCWRVRMMAIEWSWIRMAVADTRRHCIADGHLIPDPPFRNHPPASTFTSLIIHHVSQWSVITHIVLFSIHPDLLSQPPSSTNPSVSRQWWY